MLFVLSGPWGVGKASSIRYLKENYDFEAIIPWTTKKLLKNEEGTEYNHIEWKKDFKIELFISEIEGFWTQPFLKQDNLNFYGYKKSDIERVANSIKPVIIEADTGIVDQLKNSINSSKPITGKIYFIFLDYMDNKTFEAKLQVLDSNIRSQKRFHAEKERTYLNSNRSLFDKIIKSDIHENIFEELVDYVLQIANDSPFMLHNRPGPLSNYDIDLAISKKNIIISVEDDLFNKIYNDSSQIYVSKDCSIDLHLSTKCKIINKKDIDYFDLISGDPDETNKKLVKLSGTNLDDETLLDIKEILSNNREAALYKIFIDKTIDIKQGLLLKAGDVVLCSSVEKININKNIMAFITSKCSYSQLGLSISISQNILQPNHDGVVFFQIVNNLPFDVNIYPYIKIAQVVFFRTISNIKTNNYNMSNHTGNNDVMISHYYNDKSFIKVNDYIVSKKSKDSYHRINIKRDKSKEISKTGFLITSIITTLVAIATLILNMIIKFGDKP